MNQEEQRARVEAERARLRDRVERLLAKYGPDERIPEGEMRRMAEEINEFVETLPPEQRRQRCRT